MFVLAVRNLKQLLRHTVDRVVKNILSHKMHIKHRENFGPIKNIISVLFVTYVANPNFLRIHYC